MRKICHELLPLKIHEHLFTCQRGIRDVRRCNFCTIFFVENVDEMNLIKYTAHLFSYNCSMFEVYSLFEQVQTSDAHLNILYKTSYFISHGPKSNNYGEMICELINNPFALYVFYLEIFCHVYFNLLKDVTEIIMFNYFAQEKLTVKMNVNKRASAHRVLISCYCMSARKNASVDQTMIEKIFKSYLVKKDYNDKQLTILRKDD